jgi:hypothetical protein
MEEDQEFRYLVKEMVEIINGQTFVHPDHQDWLEIARVLLDKNQ